MLSVFRIVLTPSLLNSWTHVEHTVNTNTQRTEYSAKIGIKTSSIWLSRKEPGSFSLQSSLQALLQVKIIPTLLQGDVLTAQCGVDTLFYLKVLHKVAISLMKIPALQAVSPSRIFFYPSLFKNKETILYWLFDWLSEWPIEASSPLFPPPNSFTENTFPLSNSSSISPGFGERVPKVPTWNSPIQPVFPFLLLESLQVPQQWHNSHEELSTCLSVSPINASLLRTTEGLRGSCLRPHRNSKAELPQDPCGVFLDALPHYNLMLTFEQCPPVLHSCLVLP